MTRACFALRDFQTLLLFSQFAIASYEGWTKEVIGEGFISIAGKVQEGLW
jgi:hypothetical protein